MTIETKFNIGDEVWLLAYGKAVKGKITRFKTSLSESCFRDSGYSEDIPKYKMEYLGKGQSGEPRKKWKSVYNIFKTKEELIESLFN